MNELIISEKDEEIFFDAVSGDVDYLDPRMIEVKDKLGNTPLHYAGIAGNVEILSNPNVSKIKNKDGLSPLLYLAMAGKVEVLSHSDASKDVNEIGNTCLHYLALLGVDEVMDHPDVHVVRNMYGVSPADMYVSIAISKRINAEDKINR